MLQMKPLGHGTMPAGHTFIEGMHSFALNEVGRFDEARDFGERSLAADPLDVWARHALAHVYEDTDDHVGPFAQPVDDLAFAFVAPLRPHDNDIGHGMPSRNSKPTGV